MMEISYINQILFNNNCLIQLHIDIELDSFKYNLLLTLTKDPLICKNITVKFYDISHLKANDIGGGLTQMMHLQIIELNRGYDRIKYWLKDQEDQKLSFGFSHYEIIE